MRTQSALLGNASFPSEKLTLSGNDKSKNIVIPDGSKNGENVIADTAVSGPGTAGTYISSGNSVSPFTVSKLAAINP
jgi:hypothetical protein